MEKTIFAHSLFADLMASNKSEFAAGMATGVLLLYLLSVLLGFPSTLVAGLLLLFPVVLLVMILIVLTDERRSEKTFDEYFYEDMEMRRNVSGTFQ